MIYSDNIHISTKGIKFTDKHGNTLSINKAFKKAFVRFFNWALDFKLFLIHWISVNVPIWFVRRLVFNLAGLTVERGSVIHMGARFFDPRGIKIGEDTMIGDNAFLDGRSNLYIGNHVDIASQVLIYNSEHDLKSEEFEAIQEPVKIEDYVFIGPRAIILPGVTIGRGAVVAAGAVVTKSVEPLSIVGGVPAKVIGERSLKKFSYKLGRARLFQ